MTDRPTRADVAFVKAYELDDNDDVAGAMDAMRTALKLYEEQGRSAEQQGDCHVFFGETETARECYLKALEYAQKVKKDWFGRKIRYIVEYWEPMDDEYERCRLKEEALSRREQPRYVRTIRTQERDRTRLVAFDLDGTLTDMEGNAWTMLNRRFGCEKQAKVLAEHYAMGEFGYHDWADRAIALLATHGAQKSSIEAVFDDVHATDGAHAAIRQLRDEGCSIGVISGSLEMILDRLFKSHDFKGVMCNRLVFDEFDNIIGSVLTPYGDGKFKAEGLRRMAARYGLRLKECAFVGNGANDVEVAKIAGKAVAFRVTSVELLDVCPVYEDGSMRNIVPYVLGRDTRFIKNINSTVSRRLMPYTPAELQAIREYLHPLQGLTGAQLDAAIAAKNKEQIAKGARFIAEGKAARVAGEHWTDAVLRVFYKGKLGLQDHEIRVAVQSDTELMTLFADDFHQCPVKTACEILKLDTRKVCRGVYHDKYQVILAAIHPGLSFDRDYEHLRPLGPYCIERITMSSVIPQK